VGSDSVYYYYCCLYLTQLTATLAFHQQIIHHPVEHLLQHQVLKMQQQGQLKQRKAYCLQWALNDRYFPPSSTVSHFGFDPTRHFDLLMPVEDHLKSQRAAAVPAAVEVRAFDSSFLFYFSKTIRIQNH
jgi:hypothetical protein